MSNTTTNTSPVILPTINEYPDHHASHECCRGWLHDRKGDDFTMWTSQQAREEIHTRK